MDYSRLQKLYKHFGMSILPIRVGQFLELHEEISLGDNKKIWKFKCLVIKTWKQGHPDGTFTVRGVSGGITIEKIYPFAFKNFKKIILLDEYKKRRAKLYYLRNKVGKSARMKSVITSNRRGIDLLSIS